MMRDNKISVVVASTKLAAIEEEENEVDGELLHNFSSPDPPSAVAIGADSSCFSTPTAKEYQIPEPSACPRLPTARNRYLISPASSGPLKAAKKVHYKAKRKIMFVLSPEIKSAAVTFGNLLAVETFRTSTKGNSAPKYFR